MISEGQLRDLFELWTGFHPTLDHGDVSPSYRRVNDVIEPINAVMSIDPWNFTPVKTIYMAVNSATVTIIARSDAEADEAQGVINEALKPIRGTTIPVVDEVDGRSILLTVNAGAAYRSEAVHGSLLGHGDECDVVVHLDYIAIANGTSSTDTALVIDGHQIEIQSIASVMVCATDDQPGDDGLTTTATPSKAFQIEANVFVLDNDAGKMLLEEGMSLTRGKTIRCVEYRVGRNTQYYMMAMTQCRLGSAELNNVGATITLSLANPDAMPFDARWVETLVIGDVTSIGASPGTIVFWGDNKADRVDDTGMISHVYTDGVDKHTIHIFGEYDAPPTRQLRIGDNIAGKRIKYVGDDWDVGGEANMTLISCKQSTLSIESGYIRELRDDGTAMVTVTDHIKTGHEWVSSLDVVTGIRDASLWHVYTSEVGI